MSRPDDAPTPPPAPPDGPDGPRPGRRDRLPAEEVLAVLADAIGAAAGEASLDRVLHLLASRARELVGARYAAIGLPEPEGDEFARFVTVGMSDELMERIGPLPRTHGMLAAMLGSPEPYRTDDVTADPRFEWWPPAHPRMGSFMGVPLVAKGDVIGAFYLADKEPEGSFDEADEAAMVLLATYAAVAVDHARLFEDSRELALVDERARLARDLHDAMGQSLFGLQLSAEAARGLLPRDPDGAAAELATVGELAGRIAADLREVVEGLRPADLERDGLVPTLRSQLAVAGRAHGVAVELVVAPAGGPPSGPAADGPGGEAVVDGTAGEAGASTDGAGWVGLDPEAEYQVLRVTQEAVANALRHAKASRVTVGLAPGDGGLVVRVTDDGVGFDPGARRHRARRLGLTSMHERADALGGTLAIRSAPDEGTTVELRVPA